MVNTEPTDHDEIRADVGREVRDLFLGLALKNVKPRSPVRRARSERVEPLQHEVRERHACVLLVRPLRDDGDEVKIGTLVTSGLIDRVLEHDLRVLGAIEGHDEAKAARGGGRRHAPYLVHPTCRGPAGSPIASHGIMTIPDSALAGTIRRTLEDHSLLPRDSVRATVTDGIVTLEGRVPYTTQRLEAARSIAGLVGVRGVVNKIELIEPHVAPHAIRSAIADALVRHAERELRDLQIDIVDGCVTLTGDVQSEGERRAIIGAVTGTAGVETVISQLHVR